MSRSLDDLHPEMRQRVDQLLSLCAVEGLDLLVYCTKRTLEEQGKLYMQGRTADQINTAVRDLEVMGYYKQAAALYPVEPIDGRVVTWAKPGQSAHNYGLAIDAVPMMHGKPQWDAKSWLWGVYGGLCRRSGLEWAGDWKGRKREFPHAQVKGFNWRKAITG